MHKPKPYKLLTAFSNQTIDRLALQVRNQQALLHQVRKALPKQLADHVQHSVLSENKVIIYTDSAIWASQLRFHQQQILSALSHVTGLAAPEVKIKLMIEKTGPNSPLAEKANVPSSENLHALKNLCSSLSGSEWTFALGRLIKTLENI